MNVRVSESCGVKTVHLGGEVLWTDAPRFADFVDATLADGNRHIIWDLAELDPEVTTDTACVVVEGLARLRAEDAPVVMLAPPERLVGFIRQLGLERTVFVACSEKDALVQLFRGIEKRFDDSLFQLLIREGYVTKEQLGQAHAEWERRGRAVPIDEIMLEMELLTVEDMLKVLARRKTFLGEILVDTRLITQETLDEILAIQKERGGKLGDLLKEMGAITDRDIYEALAIQYWRKTELEEEGEREVTPDDLVGFLSSDDWIIVKDAEERLLRFGRDVTPMLVERLEHEDEAQRPAIARILGSLGDGRALPVLASLLDAPDPALRDEAYWALVKSTGHDLPATATWRWGRYARRNAASLPQSHPPVPADREDSWERILAEFLEGQRPLNDVAIEYEAGRVAWEGGKVNLLIHGDGRVFLKRNCRNDISLTSTTVAGARVRELMETMWSNKVWKIRTKRTYGDPAEPRHVLSFTAKPDLRLSIFYWATEMYGDLALMNLENAVKVVLRFLAL